MSQALLTIFIFTITQAALAESPEYKSWKLFQSNYGYEFKYPDCWSVRIDNSDYEGKVESSAFILIYEDKCKTKKTDPEFENSIGFGVFFSKLNADLKKKMSARDKEINVGLRNGDILRVEKGSNSSGTTYKIAQFSDPSKNKVLWKMIIFCDDNEILLSGPSIAHVSKEMIKKIKDGIIPMSEPQKTIYESVRCIKDKK